MSEAARTFEPKKDLYRQEIANLRQVVRDLEDQIRDKLEELNRLKYIRDKQC